MMLNNNLIFTSHQYIYVSIFVFLNVLLQVINKMAYLKGPYWVLFSLQFTSQFYVIYYLDVVNSASPESKTGTSNSNTCFFFPLLDNLLFENFI